MTKKTFQRKFPLRGLFIWSLRSFLQECLEEVGDPGIGLVLAVDPSLLADFLPCETGQGTVVGGAAGEILG
jgi:hypothetical protein